MHDMQAQLEKLRVVDAEDCALISKLATDGRKREATHMIFETTFWITVVAASRIIAKIYRRRDVLYGPYLQRND